VAPSSHLEAQRGVGGPQHLAVKFGARVVEPRDTASDIAWLRGVTLGLDRQMAYDADPLAGRHVLKADPGRAHDVDLANRRAVQVRNGSAGPAKEDISKRGALAVIGGVVHIQHDFPRGARLYLVEVTQDHDHLQAREIDAVRVTFADMP